MLVITPLLTLIMRMIKLVIGLCMLSYGLL